MDTILEERVTKRHRVPFVREYLVWWKGLLRRKASWERGDPLDKFTDWVWWFKTELLMRSLMSWV